VVQQGWWLGWQLARLVVGALSYCLEVDDAAMIEAKGAVLVGVMFGLDSPYSQPCATLNEILYTRCSKQVLRFLTLSILACACRTRQASITTELIEIISGATALADK